jgi:hypothetical protein
MAFHIVENGVKEIRKKDYCKIVKKGAVSVKGIGIADFYPEHVFIYI